MVFPGRKWYNLKAAHAALLIRPPVPRLRLPVGHCRQTHPRKPSFAFQRMNSMSQQTERPLLLPIFALALAGLLALAGSPASLCPTSRGAAGGGRCSQPRQPGRAEGPERARQGPGGQGAAGGGPGLRRQRRGGQRRRAGDDRGPRRRACRPARDVRLPRRPPRPRRDPGQRQDGRRRPDADHRSAATGRTWRSPSRKISGWASGAWP